jgi:glucose/arabinose dehydrogenase
VFSLVDKLTSQLNLENQFVEERVYNNNIILATIIMSTIIFSVSSITLTIISSPANNISVVAQQQVPHTIDPNLRIELVTDLLADPTAMAFIGDNQILIVEKDGKVRKLVDGKVLDEPLLQLDVSSKDEQGLLGIAVSNSSVASSRSASGSSLLPGRPDNVVSVSGNNQTKYIFLYFTEPSASGGNLHNVIYRYELNDDQLVNPRLLIELPALPGPSHVGGRLEIGPDDNLYITVGEQIPSSYQGSEYQTKAQNYKNGLEPDGRGGIIRITQDGKAVEGTALLGNGDPLNKYFAYGIRNSFGIDFDPITGNLWATENGPDCCDEINLIEPGFNGGWDKIAGFWPVDGTRLNVLREEKIVEQDIVNDPNAYNIEVFEGKGRYSNPEFVWYDTVAPTAINFFDSDKLGTAYQDDMLVADAKTGRIYQFELSDNRTQISLGEGLSDAVAENSDELANVVFAEGFQDVISDMKVGPSDGYLYVLSGVRGETGNLYRVLPAR